MGAPNLVPIPADGDWAAVRKAIARLASRSLGPNSTPTFAGMTVATLSATSLVVSNLELSAADGLLEITSGVVGSTTSIDGGTSAV
jgi:hypothetical protein